MLSRTAPPAHLKAAVGDGTGAWLRPLHRRVADAEKHRRQPHEMQERDGQHAHRDHGGQLRRSSGAVDAASVSAVAIVGGLPRALIARGTRAGNYGATTAARAGSDDTPTGNCAVNRPWSMPAERESTIAVRLAYSPLEATERLVQRRERGQQGRVGWRRTGIGPPELNAVERAVR